MCYAVRVAAPDLPAITKITRGDTTYHVLGTAHVSQRSIADVEQAIATLAPDLVCVELDATRRDALLGNTPRPRLLEVARRHGVVFAIAQLALSSYQRRIGKRLGVKPGAELLAAIRAAEARAIPVELVDRDVHVTLARAWAALTLPQRALVTGAFVVALARAGGDDISREMIEQLKEQRALSDLLAELAKALPTVKAPLIDERDAYMASKLVEVGGGRRAVLAVVGAAHVPGIAGHLRGVAAIDRAPLLAIP